MESAKSRFLRYVKSRGHYIWDLNMFSEVKDEYGGGPVCGTFTLWVNGKTTLDGMLEELEKLDGVSYITLM